MQGPRLGCIYSYNKYIYIYKKKIMEYDYEVFKVLLYLY